ncbi:hypothetical protein, partial [Streptococcus pneumoniae]|uniref:hypothetical protein n=1 Tax=Streptococcus pneumoniae TaxID=1313 RepID=UPI0018B06ED1
AVTDSKLNEALKESMDEYVRLRFRTVHNRIAALDTRLTDLERREGKADGEWIDRSAHEIKEAYRMLNDRWHNTPNIEAVIR